MRGKQAATVGAALVLAVLFAAPPIAAQSISQRGFVEVRGLFYPQTVKRDQTRAMGDLLVRYEPTLTLAPWLRIAASFDGRIDSHDQVSRSWDIDWRDRTNQRPALSVRRLEASLTRGPLSLDVGKQFIRWGKADVLNPTDRFAPRDFLEVTDSDFLAVTAVRAQVAGEHDSIDLIWQPLFTPSRSPLFEQRWNILPEALIAVPLVDGGAQFPKRYQAGARWNRVESAYEVSASFYDGFNSLPLVTSQLTQVGLDFVRVYPRLRMYGGDAAVPLRWFTIKGEAAYLQDPAAGTNGNTAEDDDYVLYVIQLERQRGEWSIVGGYAGQVVTAKRTTIDFSPDRGLSRSFLGRASYTIDTNRSVAFEGALRQNGDGGWLRVEYSQAAGQHWRATLRGTLIRGDPTDFLGQYRLNSHATIALRYSF